MAVGNAAASIAIVASRMSRCFSEHKRGDEGGKKQPLLQRGEGGRHGGRVNGGRKDPWWDVLAIFAEKSEVSYFLHFNQKETQRQHKTFSLLIFEILPGAFSPSEG